MNRVWSEEKVLLSTSTTFPNPLPISHPTSSLIKSNGKPHTWTQIRRVVKVTELVVRPLSYRRRTSRLLSKLQGPLCSTHNNWLSILKRNWNSPSPTSTVFKSFPNFHAARSMAFAALWFYGLVVRNLPRSVREHSSIIFSRWDNRTCTTSPSSVSWMFWSLSMKSASIFCCYRSIVLSQWKRELT